MNKKVTDQEVFWSGGFGDAYTNRNKDIQLLASNLNFFTRVFHHKFRPNSLIEFGANIGMNLQAVKLIFPSIRLFGVEINDKAADELSGLIGVENVFKGSVFDYKPDECFDVSLSKGFLIHINPCLLDIVYDKLYHSSKKYILICEYYNPTPISVVYRGFKDRLFKRDFCGEIIKKYPDLILLDYGFCYKGDTVFPMDDVNWFLLEKK